MEVGGGSVTGDIDFYENRALTRAVINRVIPFRVILDQAGFDVGSGDHNIFCP